MTDTDTNTNIYVEFSSSASSYVKGDEITCCECGEKSVSFDAVRESPMETQTSDACIKCRLTKAMWLVRDDSPELTPCANCMVYGFRTGWKVGKYPGSKGRCTNCRAYFSVKDRIKDNVEDATRFTREAGGIYYVFGENVPSSIFDACVKRFTEIL